MHLTSKEEEALGVKHLLVTENKSNSPEDVRFGVVRVFVDRDFDYGYFINEDLLLSFLTEEQKTVYFASSDPVLYVCVDIAQRIIDMGSTINAYKPRLS